MLGSNLINVQIGQFKKKKSPAAGNLCAFGAFCESCDIACLGGVTSLGAAGASGCPPWLWASNGNSTAHSSAAPRSSADFFAISAAASSPPSSAYCWLHASCCAQAHVSRSNGWIPTLAAVMDARLSPWLARGSLPGLLRRAKLTVAGKEKPDLFNCLVTDCF